MLTDTAIKKAKPKEKAYKLGDSGGLYLYIMPSGYRSWRMKFRYGGKEKRLVFASYPDTALLQARAMRENAAKLLRGGVDPSIHKVQQAGGRQALRLFRQPRPRRLRSPGSRRYPAPGCRFPRRTRPDHVAAKSRRRWRVGYIRRRPGDRQRRLQCDRYPHPRVPADAGQASRQAASDRVVDGGNPSRRTVHATPAMLKLANAA